MKKKISYGILYCFLCVVLFYTLFQWQKLNHFSNQAGLRFKEGVLSVEKIEEYDMREKDRQIEITAWKLENGKSIVWKETGRVVEGTVLKVYGNMKRVLPFFLKYGSIPFYGDTSGCIISSELAWKLFGAENVIGNVISYDGKEWIIRGVLNLEESLFVQHQQDKQEKMSYVELWTEEVPPSSNLEQIKSSLGLFGDSYVFTGSFYCSMARVLLYTPFWVIYFYICMAFFRLKEKIVTRYKGWIQIAGTILLLLVFIGGAYCTISFTDDFIPVQWSDFEFWKEKREEIISGIRQRRQFPEIYWEQQVIMTVSKIAAGVVVLAAQIILIVNKKVATFF